MPLSTRSPATRSAAMPDACAARSCSASLRRSSGLLSRWPSHSSRGVPRSTTSPSRTEMRTRTTALTRSPVSAATATITAMLTAPTRLASSVAMFVSSPGSRPLSAPPCGARIRPTSRSEAVGRGLRRPFTGARAEPETERQSHVDDGQRRDAQQQPAGVALGDTLVDHDTDEHGDQCLTRLVPRAEQRADRHVAALSRDRAPQNIPPRQVCCPHRTPPDLLGSAHGPSTRT